MVIQIIPKKSETKSPDLFNVLFYFCLFLLIVFILGSAALFLFQKNMNQTLQNLKTQIAAKGTPEELALEKTTLLAQKKINDFSDLINFHKSNSKFFTALESITHPKVFFSKEDLRISQGMVSLSGIAENFEALGQQFLIFKNEDYIKDVTLSKAVIGEGGKIDFSFDISFAVGKFKY